MSATENLRAKIVSKDRLVTRLAKPRTERVVFTNGCFDVLHRGHVEYLAMARDAGDILVVGLNSDASVRRLKGNDRPVNSESDRAHILAGLAATDFITIFDQDTPLELIRALLPDVLVKGGDYRAEDVIGAREVTEAGGEILIAPLVAGRSTTNLLQRLNSRKT